MKIKKYLANLLLIKNLILFIPLIFDKELKELVYKDLDVQDYQCRYKKTRSILFVNYLLCFDYSFRAIYQFRLRNHIVTWIMSRIFVPNKLHIEISGKIGGDLESFMARML